MDHLRSTYTVSKKRPTFDLL